MPYISNNKTDPEKKKKKNPIKLEPKEPFKEPAGLYLSIRSGKRSIKLLKFHYAANMMSYRQILARICIYNSTYKGNGLINCLTEKGTKTVVIEPGGSTPVDRVTRSEHCLPSLLADES